MKLDISTDPDDRTAPTTYITAVPLLLAVGPVCAAPPGIAYLDNPIYAAPDLTALIQPQSTAV